MIKGSENVKIQIAKMGLIEYGEALKIQEKLWELRRNGTIDDTFLLLEHKPVLTLGRRGNYDNILLSKETLKEQGIDIYEVSRGGDVTYHGPGQIVGYPIMDLNYWGKDSKEFVGNIQEVIIRLLCNEYGINAQRDDKKYTGVWIEDRKITAIGIAIRHWVTMHGFAFNVNTNLAHFNWITPCGITDRGVTSMEKELGQAQDMNLVYSQIIKYFCEVFNAELVELTADDIYKIVSEVDC